MIDNSNPVEICSEDLDHHVKFFGTAKRKSAETGALESYTPSPIDVVKLGIVDISYLSKFNSNSYWNEEIKEYLKSIPKH